MQEIKKVLLHAIVHIMILIGIQRVFISSLSLFLTSYTEVQVNVISTIAALLICACYMAILYIYNISITIHIRNNLNSDKVEESIYEISKPDIFNK